MAAWAQLLLVFNNDIDKMRLKKPLKLQNAIYVHKAVWGHATIYSY